MASLAFPIALAVLGLVVGMIAYRTMQRGNARFYALEREKLLRQAGYSMLGSLALMAGSVSLLVNQERAQQAEIADATATAEAATSIASIEGGGNIAVQPTMAGKEFVNDVPPTIVATPTIDPNVPTATRKPTPKYATIANTGESGVYIRSAPGTNAETIARLYDTNVVTLEEDEDPVEANGLQWVKVRTVTGDIGWVADPFLEINK